MQLQGGNENNIVDLRLPSLDNLPRRKGGKSDDPLAAESTYQVHILGAAAARTWFRNPEDKLSEADRWRSWPLKAVLERDDRSTVQIIQLQWVPLVKNTRREKVLLQPWTTSALCDLGRVTSSSAVLVLLSSLNIVSKLITNHPLYTLNASNTSVWLRLYSWTTSRELRVSCDRLDAQDLESF